MRFICHGGSVISKNDGQIHYVSAKKVALLYNIPSHFWATHDVIISKDKGKKYNNKDDIHLYPRCKLHDTLKGVGFLNPFASSSFCFIGCSNRQRL